MDISRFQGLSDLFEKLQSRGRGNSRRSEKIQELLKRAAERREARRNRRREDEVSIPEQPKGTTPTEETTPPTTGTQSSKELSIDELAELYVKQYEEGSGQKLSDEEFKAKATEVADFYSGLSDGQNRLDKVVFANDQNNQGLTVA